MMTAIVLSFASALFGAEADPEVERLIEALRSENPAARAEAATALGKLGPRASGAARLVVKSYLRLGETDSPVARTMRNALVGLGKPAAVALVERLDVADSDSQQLHDVLRALMEVVPVAPDIIAPAFARALKKNNEKLAWNVISSMRWTDLELLRGDRDDLVPALAEWMGSPDAELSFRATEVLFGINPNHEEATRVLVKALRGSEQSEHRLAAACHLAKSKKYAERAIPIVMRALALTRKSGGSLWVAAYVAGAAHLGAAMTKLGDDARQFVPLLTSELEAAKREAPRVAFVSAGLILLADGKNREARDYLLATLPALTDFLGFAEEGAFSLVFFATEVLGELGPAAAKAVPALEKLLESPNPEYRKAARRALRKIRRGEP
jgi:HEAT repeat protein